MGSTAGRPRASGFHAARASLSVLACLIEAVASSSWRSSPDCARPTP